MNFKRHITLISPIGFNYAGDATEIKHLLQFENIEANLVTTIADAYALLCNPSYYTTVIGIDIEGLFSLPDIDAWNAINTLANIIKTTKYKNPISGLLEPRKVFIVAGVKLTTDIKLIRKFLDSNDLCLGLMPRGDGFTTEQKRQALLAFQRGEKHIPKLIQDRLKPKKKSKLDPFKLTARQQQIFDLILERGISNKVIARTLNISESTVKLHMTSILKKCGVRNRTQLAVFSKKPPLLN